MSISVTLRKKQPTAKGRISLYLDIYTHGQRDYEFLDIYLHKDNPARVNREIYQRGEQRAREVEARLMRGESYVSPDGKKQSFLTYFEAQAEKKISPSTRQLWKRTLQHLKEFNGNKPLPFNMITKKWLEEWKEYLLRRLSQNTAFAVYSHVRTALRQAVADEVITHTDSDRVKPIRQKQTDPTYLEVPEVERLFATPCRNPEVARAFIFSCFQGLRISDTKALRWKHITVSRVEYRQKKTGNMAYVDLSPQAAELLGERGAPEELVFNLPSLGNINKVLQSWAADAKVEKHLTTHVGRHTFATMLITYGADLYTTSKLLGHTDVRMTQRYAHIVDKHRQATIAKLPVLGQQQSTG